MDFRPLATEERNELLNALRSNIEGKSILVSRIDTSFEGLAQPDECIDEEIVMAIRSVPCHY